MLYKQSKADTVVSVIHAEPAQLQSLTTVKQ